jgi:hypothetical protein
MNEPHRVIIKIAGAETQIFQVSGVSVQVSAHRGSRFRVQSSEVEKIAPLNVKC